MDFHDGLSAIDDTNLPIIYHHLTQPHPSSQNPDNQPLTRENFGYNGPRSGHWSVKDTVLGSGIDDGVATVHYRRSADAGDGGVGRHSGRVDWALVGKLAKAGASKACAQSDVAGGDAVKDVIVEAGRRSQAQVQVPTAEVPVAAKFYVPKLDSRGIRIQGRDGKKEVVRTPRVPSVRIEAQETKWELGEVMPPSVTPHKPASQVSQQSQCSKRAIRITGKNGEEAFMELPYMPQLSRSSHSAGSPVHISAKPKSPNVNGTRAQSNRAEEAARDMKAARVAAQMRREREAQAEVEAKRATQAKLAAEAMMSGALPSSSKLSSARKEEFKRSDESSGKSLQAKSGLVSKSSSKPPSIASSKTSVPPQSVRETNERQSRDVSGSIKSSARSSQRPQSIPSTASLSKEVEQVARRDSTSKTTSITSNPKISRPATSTPSRQSHPPTAAARSSLRSSHSSHHSQPNENGPTIFAGHGWISPHPLSIAPTEYEQPPDSVIKIPGGSRFSNAGADGGKRDTMTYDEWRELQRGEHEEPDKEQVQHQRARRNFSRSSSSATRYRGGSWGFRNLPASGVAEAVSEHDWASVGSGAVGGKYESPRVESVRSDHGSERSKRTFEHEFDGAADDAEADDAEAGWERLGGSGVGGKVRLKMPWDAQA